MGLQQHPLKYLYNKYIDKCLNTYISSYKVFLKNSSESLQKLLLILKNKKYLRDIININEEYTCDGFIELLSDMCTLIECQSDEILKFT